MSSVLPTPSIQLARSLLQVPLDDLHNMSAMDLFQRQLESGSTEAAIDAMKRLSVVAIAMGEKAAATTLVPYLTAMVQQQPMPVDELLLLLGQQLIPLSNFLKENRMEFLPLFERLAAVEETVVRDQAVTVMVHVLTTPPKSDPLPWLALVKRLAAADWFTAKISAAGVVASTLRLVTEAAMIPQQAELLAVFKELCQDETPMVRRAAAKHMGFVLKEAGWDHRDFAATCLPPLCRDEQDSVRQLAVASLANAGNSFGEHPQWTVQQWLPIVKDGATDLSWRVRNQLAKNFADVATTMGIQHDKRFTNEQSLVMACFVALLSDVESEVRASAVGQLARMIAWGGPTHFAQHLQPMLPTLADDVVMEVRSKCALALMDAAQAAALDDAVILQSFGPLLESFLGDEFHEVQLQVLSNLHKISRLLSGLTGVVGVLLQMSRAGNWRVRQAIAQLLPFLAEARGMEYFQTVLFDAAWQAMLLDPVATVRHAVVQGTGLLVQVAGRDWVVGTLLPRMKTLFDQAAQSYLVRMTLLSVYIEMAVGGVEEAAPLVLQTLQTDKVPNVRMVAARGLGRIAAIASDPVPIIAALEARARDDSDEDCRDACVKALAQSSLAAL